MAGNNPKQNAVNIKPVVCVPNIIMPEILVTQDQQTNKTLKATLWFYQSFLLLCFSYGNAERGLFSNV